MDNHKPDLVEEVVLTQLEIEELEDVIAPGVTLSE
jgi:hypothetical protein